MINHYSIKRIIFIHNFNSQYYDISEFNQINHNKEASFNLIHTNLASIAKHHDDLQLTLSLLKTKFDVIGITEHKIKKDMQISNIEYTRVSTFCL